MRVIACTRRLFLVVSFHIAAPFAVILFFIFLSLPWMFPVS
jgi:hypothetical protein